MKKQPTKIKLCFLIAVLTIFISGCSSVDNPQRIDGIIDAVYTSYETDKDFNKTKEYLQQKVERNEISSFTSSLIEKCLKRGSSK